MQMPQIRKKIKTLFLKYIFFRETFFCRDSVEEKKGRENDHQKKINDLQSRKVPLLKSEKNASICEISLQIAFDGGTQIKETH